MNVNKVLTRDYEKKTLGEHGKNKPNTNPIQSQYKPNSKPISSKAKMNANAFSQKDYENETAFRPQKNKPNSNPIKPNFKPNLVKMGHHEGKMFFTHFLNSNAANRELKMIK